MYGNRKLIENLLKNGQKRNRPGLQVNTPNTVIDKSVETYRSETKPTVKFDTFAKLAPTIGMIDEFRFLFLLSLS